MIYIYIYQKVSEYFEVKIVFFLSLFVFNQVELNGSEQETLPSTNFTKIYDNLTPGETYEVKVITTSNTKTSSVAIAYGTTCEFCLVVIFTVLYLYGTKHKLIYLMYLFTRSQLSRCLQKTAQILST